MALGVGVAFIDVSWKDSKNKNQKVSLGWTNVGTKSGINALAQFCTALSDLNKELWKEFASYALTGSKKGKKVLDYAEKIIKAICDKNYANSLIQDMGSTVASKLKSTITNKFRQFIKDNVASGDVIVTAADQLKTLETKQTAVTTAINNNDNVISKLKEFTTACNKLEKTLDLSESTFTIDTPTGLSYNKNFTAITVSPSYGKKLNSADYDSNVTSINASNRTTAITIEGNSKGNTINGSKGADTIYGNAGSDNISGGNGNDTLFGGVGNDKLYGQNGNDSLIGGVGNDNLTGGAGKDIFYYKDGDGNDTITDYKAGEDKIQIASGTVTASMSGKKAIFKVGKGKITVNNGKDKNITIIDSNGNEKVYYNGKDSSGNDDDGSGTNTGGIINVNGVKVTLNDNTTSPFKLDDYNTGKSVSNKAVNIEATSAEKSLTIYGDEKPNVIWAGSGYNTLIGGAGNDALYSGSYRETRFNYNKGDGNDTIYNLKNYDDIRLFDCSLKNIAVGNEDVILTVATGVNLDKDVGTITLKNAVNKSFYINGSGYYEYASSSIQNGEFVIDDNAYGDFFLKQHSNISSTAKNINASGNENTLKIYGDDRANVISAGSGYNTITGGAGDDVLYSGSYRETTFHYNKGDGNDTIFNLKNNDDIRLYDCSVKSTALKGNDVVITIASGVNLDKDIGTITLKAAKGVSFYLNGSSKKFDDTTSSNFEERNDVEEHWFTEDDNNFTTSEVSSILKSDNLISNDCELESELQFNQQFIKDTTLTSITYDRTKKN